MDYIQVYNHVGPQKMAEWWEQHRKRASVFKLLGYDDNLNAYVCVSGTSEKKERIKTRDRIYSLKRAYSLNRKCKCGASIVNKSKSGLCRKCVKKQSCETRRENKIARLNG